MTVEAPPSGTVLCILPGPTHEVRREPDKEKPGGRWCFRCRRRGVHEWVLMGEPPLPEWVTDQLDDPGLDGYAAIELFVRFASYYDPQWFLRCPTCNEDHTQFPGRTW